jgi:hypothetical protein
MNTTDRARMAHRLNLRAVNLTLKGTARNIP